jgi:type II secretory pathway component PulJ
VTLTDLLASLALLGLVLGGTLAVLEEGQRAWARGAARLEAQQGARVGLERLVRELRQAGAGLDADEPALSVTEPSRLVLHVDLDGDGRATGRGETITWWLDGTVLRRSAGAGGQPVVQGIHALRLRYLDATGAPAAAPAAVRTVVVALTGGAQSVAGPPAATVATLATEVRLRNR